MKRITPFCFSILLSFSSFAQSSNNIPVINGTVEQKIDASKIVVKEPKVHFTSKESKAFSVVDGKIIMSSNFNVVIEGNGMYYVYQDVKGNPDLLNKEIKRGDEIGSMYFNDEKQVYSLYISILKGPKQYLTHEEVLKTISE